MLHSIYDLTTYCRKTTGDVPPKLVGASSTVVGSKMYLFGGRLVTERRMVADLYMFDLESFVWEKIPNFPDDDVPKPRYFHSADAWNNQLVIFGGMSSQPDAANPDDLCVLNDVRFFDLTTRRWLPPAPTPQDSDLVPRGRYAHLSSVTARRLFIIGGQDFYNTWLDDICVFDLATKSWVQRRDYPRHCGTYRSVAVSSNVTVRLPQDEIRNTHPASIIGPPGARFKSDKIPNPSIEATASESLVHLSYSAVPTDDHPSDIYLYSNYNFTDVKRELEVFSPLEGDFTVQDRSQAMTGTSFPPGLRFPTGAILGTHLIIAGTYLTHSYQTFSIWVLDLISMTWSRIDPGRAVEAGSWFRGCLWAEANRFLIFGNKNGNLVDDYNRRLLSWDHVAVVDLEAFGIYQPPPLKLDIRMQELGLAALEERIITDFEIICDDGRKITCSRKVLEDRWPWFKEQRKRFLQLALSTLDTLPSSSMHQPLPEMPGLGTADELKLDPRLTPRSFFLSEPYPVTLALLQYFYSMGLITPLQHAPAVLSQLLVLATNYKIDHLASLVKHAMHKALSNATSVGVYEVATLCSCRSLQIRALRTVMSYTQKRPSRSKGDKDAGGGGGGGRTTDGSGSGPSSFGPSNEHKYISRPRGTSDAKWSTLGESSGGASGYNTRAGGFAGLEVYEEEAIPKLSDEPAAVSREPELLAPPRQHKATESIVSFKTHDEMLEVSEMLSPTFGPGPSRLKGRVPVPHGRLPPPPSAELPQRPPPAAQLPSSPELKGQRMALESLEDVIARFHISPSPSSPSELSPPRRRHLSPIFTDTRTSDTPPLTTSPSRSSLASTCQLAYDGASTVSSSVPSTPYEPTHVLNPSTINDLLALQARLAEEHEIRLFELADDDSVLPRDIDDRKKHSITDQYSIVAESFEGERSTLNDTSSLDSGSNNARVGSFTRFLGRSKKNKGDRSSSLASSSMMGVDSVASISTDSTTSFEDDKKRLKREAKEAKEKAKREKEKAAAEARQHILATRSANRMAKQDTPALFGGVYM